MKYLAFLFILTISTAHAEVNKCIDSKGKITFTDKPCLHGQTASTVKIKPVNTMDSTQDKRAIQQVKQNQYQQASQKYQHKLRNARIRSNALSYEQNIKLQNDLRISKSKSPLPNGFGTGKGCYRESNQYYCY